MTETRRLGEELRTASQRGDVIRVRELLRRGAATDAKGLHGVTPLHRAAYNGHLQVVVELLAQGADQNGKDDDGGTPLHRAAASGHLEVVRELLDRGTNKDATDNNGDTPLHASAFQGHSEVVKELLARSAHKDAANNYGRTPLHRAATNGRLEAVKALLDQGVNNDASDDEGTSPLHRAASRGHLDVVKELLARGANKDAKNKSGVTACDLARGSGQSEVAAYLETCASRRSATRMSSISRRGTSLMQRASIQHYTYEDLERATNGFAASNKIGDGGFGSVYRGQLQHTPVAIKVLDPEGMQGAESFYTEVKVLGRIRHPHLVTLIGCCPERNCLVFELMEAGSLEDVLASEGKRQELQWYSRVRIASEIALGLLFLHSSSPPVLHLDVKPGNVLLDENLVAKVSDVGLARLCPELVRRATTLQRTHITASEDHLIGSFGYIDPDYEHTGELGPQSDVYAYGLILMQLMTGLPALGLPIRFEDANQRAGLESLMDKSAGAWPEDITSKLAEMAINCTRVLRKDRPVFSALLPDLDALRQSARAAAAREAEQEVARANTPPEMFLCPITGDLMEEPVVCSDGFTYEREAIEQWLQLGNRTSPMTNLVLEHLHVFPVFVLRSQIRAWREEHPDTQEARTSQ